MTGWQFFSKPDRYCALCGDLRCSVTERLIPRAPAFMRGVTALFIADVHALPTTTDAAMTALKEKAAALSREIEERGMALLGQMGLADRAGYYPHQLSGGQQQRVAIARALALEPDILCFDEPTSALDPELTGEVLRVIRGLADKDTTMIIVTHEMTFAHDVSDQVIFMDGGNIVEQGPPAQVLENPREERTRQFLRGYTN